MEIISSGEVQGLDYMERLVAGMRPERVVVFQGNVTHWWKLRSGGKTILYVGTPEAFEDWKTEGTQ